MINHIYYNYLIYLSHYLEIFTHMATRKLSQRVWYQTISQSHYCSQKEHSSARKATTIYTHRFSSQAIIIFNIRKAITFVIFLGK